MYILLEAAVGVIVLFKPVMSVKLGLVVENVSVFDVDTTWRILPPPGRFVKAEPFSAGKLPESFVASSVLWLVTSVPSAISGRVITLLLLDDEGACKLKDPPPEAAFSLIFAVIKLPSLTSH